MLPSNCKRTVQRLAQSSSFVLMCLALCLVATNCAHTPPIGFDVSDGSTPSAAAGDVDASLTNTGIESGATPSDPGAGAGPGFDLDAPSGDGPASHCGSVTCTPIGGQYCGTIGDGCGAKMACPACPGDSTC